MIESLPSASDPFALLPDPERYVPRPATERALAELCDAVEAGSPALLVGPPGLGKSLLLRVLVERLPKDYTDLCLSYVPASCADVCAAVLDQLAGEDAPDPEGAFLIRATVLARRGRPLLLLLDGAGGLAPAEASRLGDLVRAARGAVRLVLSLADADAARELAAALAQDARIVELREPMDRAETRAYLEARCRREGVDASLRDAILSRSDELQEQCGGVPRDLHAAVSALQLEAWRRGPGAELIPEPRTELAVVTDVAAELAAAAWPLDESDADPVRPAAEPAAATAAEPAAATAAEPAAETAAEDAAETAAEDARGAVAGAEADSADAELDPWPVPALPEPFAVAPRGTRRIAALWGFALGVLAGSGLTAAVFALVLSGGPSRLEDRPSAAAEAPEPAPAPPAEAPVARAPSADPVASGAEEAQPEAELTAPAPAAALAAVEPSPRAADPEPVPAQAPPVETAAPEPAELGSAPEDFGLSSAPEDLEPGSAPEELELSSAPEAVGADPAPAQGPDLARPEAVPAEAPAPIPAPQTARSESAAPEPSAAPSEDVSAGPPLAARAQPAPEPGAPVRVNVNARPWATISIDGVEVGETPLGDLEVEPGLRTFEARMPDGTVIERRLRIRRNGTRILFP